MGAFEEFVTRELPRRSAHLHKDIPAVGGYDGDPNAGGAPAILQSAPLGTWFHEYTSNRWWRKTLTRWVLSGNPTDIFRSDYTIYVDPAGDDSAPGTQADPIHTVREAAYRASSSLLGTGIKIKLSAGSFPLTDLSGGDSRTIFNALGILVIEATVSVADTFTVQSVSGNVITAAGSPGWTTDEHVGRMIEWDPFPTLHAQNRIIANTANTITLALTPTSLGGYYNPPGSGDLDIIQIDSEIVPAVTNPGLYVNRLFYAGHIVFDRVRFNGSGGGYAGPTAHQPGVRATFLGCTFSNWAYGVEAIGRADFSFCWFDSCSAAGAALYSGDHTLGFDNVFSSCGTAAAEIGSNGVVSTISHSTIWAKDTSRVFTMRNGGRVNDFAYCAWLSNVDEYAHLEALCTYERENRALDVFTGGSQPTTVIKCGERLGRVSLYDSASATMQGSAAYVNLAGTPLTHTAYVADLSAMDDNLNQVAG